MLPYSSQLDHLIEKLGGCGLMQKLLCVIIHIASAIAVWSMLAMPFIGYDPGFNCQTLNVKFSSISALNLSEISTNRLCSVGLYETCSAYRFPQDMNTAVSEWNLVCDRRWIVAFVTSIQMVGVLIGSVSGGQMADSIGRKPTLFTGISTMILFNFVGYFTQSWQVYSIIRFFIGIGVGIWFTVNLPQMIEFVPPPWRPLVVCIPSEPFTSMLYALISWWLHDWKKIHLLKTVVGMIFLIVLWFVPESFRWLVSKKKFERAERSVGFVAYVNRVPKPDLKEIFDSASPQNITSNTTSVYSVATLWTLKQLRNVTLPLAVLWFAINTAWFSMALGMESISVDIYLTIFLINLVDFPAYLITGPLVNRFGRKKYCFFVYGMSSILACVSGILQHFDKHSMSSVSLKFATLVVSLLTKMIVTTALTALIVYTMELYPTVVRALGYGFQSTVGRLGAVAAPLLIYVDGIVPGSLYFSSGVLIFLSVGVLARLKETKNISLPDCI